MSRKVGTFFAPHSTGEFTISSLPFTPTWARFTTGDKYGQNSNTEARHGVGFTDGTTQVATAIIANSSANGSRNKTDKCVIAMSTPSGTPSESVLAHFVEFPTNGCKLNFTTVPPVNDDFVIFAEFGDD